MTQIYRTEYFGERALLFSEPRSANVVALTHLKCFKLGKAAFTELLGPLAEDFKRVIKEENKRR